jgi:hypothetical protein
MKQDDDDSKRRRKSGDRRHRNKRELSPYEAKALRAIHMWKNPSLSWFGKILEYTNVPFAKLNELAKNVPGYEAASQHGRTALDWVLERSVNGLLHVINDWTQKTVSPSRIYADFRKVGLNVSSHKDIEGLDLEQIDLALGWLDVKYKTIAFAEGGAAGVVGLPAIAPDIVALLALNLRAIGEYATYCGFRMASQEERLFALNILGYASSPTDAAKQVALAQLIRIAREVAARKTWEQLNEHIYVQIVRKIAEALGRRLTKAKLLESIPYVSAPIGAGFNAYFTFKVCSAAFYLYRERFLAVKYGPDVIEQTVPPALTPDADFTEN